MPSHIADAIRRSTTDDYNNNDCSVVPLPETACQQAHNDEENVATTDASLSQPALQNHDDRWKHMSQLAGSHRQEDSIFCVRRRISPLSLRSGMPPQSAKRIRELRLTEDCLEAGTLPEWLDVISQTFCGLEHLHLGDMTTTATGADDAEAARRMRRLYILYRLPDLESIDGQPVEETERQVARPNDPNGHPVNKTDWVVLSSPSRDEWFAEQDDGGVGLHHLQRGISSTSSTSEDQFDAGVEVSIRGIVVKPISADPPDEPALPPHYEPSQQQREEAQAEALTMLENKHREQRRLTSMLADLEGSSPDQTRALSCGVVRAVGLGACTRNQKYLAMDEEMTTMPYRTSKARARTERTTNMSPSNERLPPAPAPPLRMEPLKLLSPQTSRLTMLPMIHQHPPPSSSPLISPKHIIVRPNSTPTRTSAPLIVPKTPQTPPPSGSPTQGNINAKTRVSPSHSLSSPFPMQFRNRNPSPPSRRYLAEEIKSDATLSDLVMDSIDLPEDTTPRLEPAEPGTTPTASTLAPRTSTTAAASRRPPTCPGRRPHVPKSVLLQNKRMERRANRKKRHQRFMRGFSVLDDDDDVGSSSGSSSDESDALLSSRRKRTNATE